eukprot:3382201-Amphidinium_carterae.1
MAKVRRMPGIDTSHNTERYFGAPLADVWPATWGCLAGGDAVRHCQLEIIQGCKAWQLCREWQDAPGDTRKLARTIVKNALHFLRLLCKRQVAAKQVSLLFRMQCRRTPLKTLAAARVAHFANLAAAPSLRPDLVLEPYVGSDADAEEEEA